MTFAERYTRAGLDAWTARVMAARGKPAERRRAEAEARARYMARMEPAAA
jgi:hypothetical protein